jgi:chaperone BCS1
MVNQRFTFHCCNVKDIFLLNLGDQGLTDETMIELVHKVPPRNILLVEDVDLAVFSNNSLRESNLDQQELDSSKDDLAVWAASLSKDSQLSLSAILNCLDGVTGVQDGRVVVMTSNQPERIPQVLMRPGRVDTHWRFSCLTSAQAKSMFKQFYRHLEGKENEQIPEKANQFAAAVAELQPDASNDIPKVSCVLTPAFVQGVLMQHKNDPAASIQAITQLGHNIEHCSHPRVQR